MKVLTLRSGHKRSNRKKSSHFSIIPVLSTQYRSQSVLLNSAVHCPNGFCPWVRGGCIACSRVRGGFQCVEDVYPDNHVQRTIEILQLPFFLASLVFRLCIYIYIYIVLIYLQLWLWIECMNIKFFFILFLRRSILLLFVSIALLLWL